MTGYPRMQANTDGDRPRLNVLLVDDDPKFRAFVQAGLQESGIDCTAASGGAEALARLQQLGAETFDIILIDIMMPGMDGWQLLERIQALSPDASVIFVTAREAIDERVRGLKLGADDYVIKPFVFSELLARIDAVVRRRQRTRLRFGKLSLDLLQRYASVGARQLVLSPKEFDLLRVLVQNSPGVVSRHTLLNEVWHVDRDPGTNVIEVHVARLRRKLGQTQGPTVRTLRGRGYAIAEAGQDDE